MIYRNIVDMYAEKETETDESMFINGDSPITSVVVNTEDGNSFVFKPTELSGYLHITNRRKQKIQITIEEEFIEGGNRGKA